MGKVLLTFCLLFSMLPMVANAELRSNCDDKITISKTNYNGFLKVNNIVVNVHKYKKWTKNSLNILIGNFRWIPKKYKKRFKADILVEYSNGLKCNFKATIRNNGNQKDHIALKDNSIIQSINVHLTTGDINGISKFKLLRPNTRGNFKDEILLTELLREFGYLAPRTSYIDAKINGVVSKMLFQEKPDIAMLDFNQRKVGPIFEGDERFMFRLAENVPDNQISNIKIGMLPLLEKGINAMLARQINSEWIFENEKNSEISYNALSNLNHIYLLYSNRYKDGKNDFDYSNYSLNNNLLALNNPKKILRLDIYNLIVFSTNGWHGLVPNNRKFYWNENENFFEPINSDTNANIEAETNIFFLPLSEQIDFAFDDLEKLLNQINIKKLKKGISLRGVEFTNDEAIKKINKIKKNLYSLKKIYEKANPDIIAYNRENVIEEKMWDKYYNSLYSINPSIYAVEHSSGNNIFKKCKTKPFKCTKINFSKDQLMDLIEGKLVIDSREYQYLRKN